MRNGYYEPYWDQPDELEHYGVLGMKWGIRRYQNKDGTLTAAGKKRYAGDTPEQIDTSERRKAKVIKAAKIAGITAAAALAGAGTYYGLTQTAAGKALIASGAKAISNLTKPKPSSRIGDYFTVENGETVYYHNGQRMPTASQTSKPTSVDISAARNAGKMSNSSLTKVYQNELARNGTTSLDRSYFTPSSKPANSLSNDSMTKVIQSELERRGTTSTGYKTHSGISLTSTGPKASSGFDYNTSYKTHSGVSGITTSAQAASPEYWEELIYNSKKNRY